jgi:carboxyvinyl-carboxyphosphonate phosphorylmutase
MMTPTEKRQRLRAVLAGPRCVSPATVYDAFTARIAESVGYEFGILSGSVSAATVLAAPDLAVQTLTEFVNQVRSVTRVSNLSVFTDADQGYGNALNVMRTVEELEHAGLAGIAIEDLIMPARFGSTADELISTDEMLGKLRAALAARQDPSLVLVARTAAVKIDTLENTVARAKAYAATGVDAVFITGMQKIEELDAIRAEVRIPIILGTAHALTNQQVESRGVRFRLQGHAPLAAVAKSLHDVYSHMHSGGLPADYKHHLASTEQMEKLIGADHYRKLQETYLR